MAQILPQAHHPVDEKEDLAHLVCIISQIVQIAYQLPLGSVSSLRVASSAQGFDLSPSNLDGQGMIVLPWAGQFVDQLARRKLQPGKLCYNGRWPQTALRQGVE